MLFGDLKGFSKLTDAQMPRFLHSIMGALADVIETHRSGLEFVNTWGDSVFLVFQHAKSAADCALALQAAMRNVDFKSMGLPESMGLRLGGHFGPVYATVDPLLKRPNFFGAHVIRAARIEPVTPEGCTYITEPFAAALALFNSGEFSIGYVGTTEAAKHYGSMPMFLLGFPRSRFSLES